jgi:hypothetical protein
MSLQVLAYNLQRVIKILGAEKLIAEMRAQSPRALAPAETPMRANREYRDPLLPLATAVCTRPQSVAATQ